MELTSKTKKPFVFVDTYRCYNLYNMTIVIWIFYKGVKFREDLFSQFCYNRENWKIKEPRN